MPNKKDTTNILQMITAVLFILTILLGTYIFMDYVGYPLHPYRICIEQCGEKYIGGANMKGDYLYGIHWTVYSCENRTVIQDNFDKCTGEYGLREDCTAYKCVERKDE